MKIASYDISQLFQFIDKLRDLSFLMYFFEMDY